MTFYASAHTVNDVIAGWYCEGEDLAECSQHGGPFPWFGDCEVLSEFEISMLRIHPDWQQLVGLIKRAFRPPVASLTWHGGPAHIQFDDYNIENDIDTAPVEWPSWPEKYLAENRVWYDFPWWNALVALWNRSSFAMRSVALADAEHQCVREYHEGETWWKA